LSHQTKLIKINNSKTTNHVKLTSNNQDKGNSNMAFDDSESWDDHTIVTWDFKGEDVIYLSNKEKKEYHVDIAQLLEDLLSKDIPMTFYVNNKGVMEREQMFMI